MKLLKAVIVSIFIIVFAINLNAQEKKITIIHTNDLHSHFLGFSPNIDFTENKINDDTTKGGWSRIATVINKIKHDRKNTVLVLDGGDFLMGSLFHMLSREEALELQILNDMGYDAIVIGNHEFDLKPKGLGRIMTAASKQKNMPAFLMANAVFSKKSEKDDSLEAVFKKGIIKPYTVIKRDGIKIGLYGVLGKDAAEVAPFASPVTFSDIIETSKKVVTTLREKEGVDMVICISHSGIYDNKDHSEDEILAREVPGIDVLISGHTHTKLEQPIIINGTPIVQSGENGLHLGILDITFANGKVTVDKYKIVAIDDSIPTDPAINRKIQAFIGKINRDVLQKHNLTFFQTIAETDFDLTLEEDESNLGNLITDAMRWYANKYDSDPKDPSTRVDIAVESYGLIRDSVYKGKTGKIAVSDLFRAFPLGIGDDDSMGYPVASFYINASEIKKAMEVLTSIWPIKGSDYVLQISGFKI